MSISAKSYLKYVLLFLAAAVGFVMAYLLSVAMFYFLIGIVALPIVVIGFPVGIYFLWSSVLKPVTNKIGKYIILVFSYILYAYMLIKLDAASWSEAGNFDYYMSIFRGE